MKNSFCIRCSKNKHFIKGYNMLPTKQPDYIIKATPTTTQAPKVLAPRVEEVSNNKESEKKF
jgi:hypothetical protein